MQWKMAWRNLWRNKRRTLLTIAAISLGLAVLITMVSFMEGMMKMMTEQIAESSIGHVQLHQPEYLEKKSSHLVMEDGAKLTEVVATVPGVKAVSPRLLFSGSIRSSLSSTVRVVQVFAVDPAREGEFSRLDDRVVEGGFIVPPPESMTPDAPLRLKSRKGILIGQKLADQLKVELGSKVRVDCAGFNGATTAAAFYVTGILQTGTDAFDKGVVFVSLQDMQAATGAGDVIHEISVMADSTDDLDSIAAAIRTAAGEQGFGAEAVVVQPWYDVLPEFKQMMDISGAWSGMLYMLMLIVLSAGILTTMYMVVLERRREFGVQLALGTRPGRLFRGVLLEALYIADLSAIVGLALGGLSVAYISTKGIDLSMFMEGFEFAGAFIDNVYKGDASVKVFLEPTLVVYLGTLFFALWPSLKVARMKPLDAIRQGGSTH
jgi:putative ABC transport system permease protein